MPYSIHHTTTNQITRHHGSKDNRIQVMKLSGHPDLQIVVNTSLHSVSSTVFRIRVSGETDSLLIKDAMTHGLLVAKATAPILRRCTPEPWPYYKVSMSGVCSQCHELWVTYLCNRCSCWVYLKCSGLQNAAECRRIKDWMCSSCSSPHTLPTPQPLPPSIPIHACRWESLHHLAIQRKWHRKQTDRLG